MKTTRISNRDWELLSEYVDNRLSQGKQARLEARIKTEPALRQALADLRRTRALLRAAPLVRAPRSFRLTPAMLTQPRRVSRPIFPVFQLASALAGILLVLVLVGDLMQPQRLTASSPAGPVALQTGEASKQADQAYSMEAQEFQAPNLAEPAGGAPAPGDANRSLATAAAEAELPAESLMLPPAAPTEDISMMAASPLSDTISVAESLPVPESFETLAISPTLLAESDQAPLPQVSGDDAGPRWPQLTGWQIAEISLAAIMVLAALAAWYFRRNGV